LLRRNRQKS